jgi:hypothetical protein
VSGVLEALLWTVLGWFGLNSTACGFWAALNTAALEADPDSVLHTAEASLAEQLRVTAAAAETAIWIDRFGASGLRVLTGFPPAPYPQAVAILGRAQADIAEGWRHVASHATTLPHRTGPPRDTTIAASTLGRLVQNAVGSLATSTRESFAPGQTLERARPEEVPTAAAVVRHLAAAQAAAAGAHVEVRHLLFRTTIWSLVALSGAGVAVTLVGSTIVALRRLSPPVPPPTSLPLAPPGRGASAARLPSGADPALAGTLTKHLVPEPVAGDIATWFARAPHIPGSLKGHDRRAGGLVEHTLDVVKEINRLTQGAPARERALAATLAASHDLGKLLSYREDAYGTWTAHSAVPHDSLGAQILALCPRLRLAFAASEVEDLLLALHTEHAPDLVPSNCRPRVQQLRRWLKEADAAAAEQDRIRSTPAASPAEVEEEVADA